MEDFEEKFISDKIFGIDDLDKPIYRIFPQWALEEALRLKRITLVPPSFWEDPYEVIESKIVITRTSKSTPYPQIFPGQGLPPIYAQSWSATVDSDTLLRAYSRVVKDPRHGRNTCPGDEGVRVRSTPRKLISALNRSVGDREKIATFIGEVHYLPQEELNQKIANDVNRIGPDIFKDPVNRAKLLMLKRNGFFHEDEVRIIAALTEHAPASSPVFNARMDINSIFDEMTFDPRLESFEITNRKREFQSWGYTGSFGESGLYQKTFLEVVIRMPEET
ncbi:hypothetical protein [Pseudomonas mandelii]|uniref:hypothetical protein n=1 Tax=Pseudomonas mandelii TaxID=75612 RepID=UPI00209E93D3|nr:hypothetical protein [Pseudomonas mandelii]MCO8309649.1 hypothetical protein [Pseudomonas mandelii]